MQNKLYPQLSFFYLHRILGTHKQPDSLFHTDYFNAVHHWVVLPQNLPSVSYFLGFVYVDPHQGFTFLFEDELRLNSKGVWNRCSSKKSGVFYWLLDARSPKLHMLDAKSRAYLDLDEFPSGLEMATYSWATWIASSRRFMSRGQYAEAIYGFERAFQENPTLPNLDFELALALNAAERYPQCIGHIMKCMTQKTSDYRLYRELGFALVQMHEPQEAEKVYEQGLLVCVQQEQKREMALDMTQTFYRLHDRARFEKWAGILRAFSAEIE